MITESMVVERIADLLSNDLKMMSVVLKSNTGTEDSIMIKTEPSKYLSTGSKEFLLARIKARGKTTHVSIHERFASLFSNAGVRISQVISQPDFLRIELEEFWGLLGQEELARSILRAMLNESVTVDPFGCCSRYLECSDKKGCVHPDALYAMGCQYNVNLQKGHIFYGANKNT